MPGVSFLGSQSVDASVAVTATTLGITIAPNASAHTKAATYTTLIASTAQPTAWLLVTVPRVATTIEYFVDIAVGAASAETVIVANLAVSLNSALALTGWNYLVPVSIPAGTRISARCQSGGASGSSLYIMVHCFAPMAGGETGLGAVETGGANTATTRGAIIDPGGTAHTKSAYSAGQLIASTAFPYRWLNVAVFHPEAVGALSTWLVDIGIGSSGAETTIIPNLFTAAGNTADATSLSVFSFPVSIPAGTRIAARAQCSVNTATERNIDVIVYGDG